MKLTEPVVPLAKAPSDNTMPITALPANTIRAVGSSQALTGPTSVVKELVENSIDAHATAIYVEISINVLDKIQVKDNGHGILPEDRHLVCSRHCTSKIRNLDDLRDLGGQSLGFRGEALASAAALSGALRFVTKIDGEDTAAECVYDAQGRVQSERKTSHPVGTTITLIDFLKNLPVRRQTVAREKASIAILAQVKRLLQAYVLARPHIRFSLKVLKAKNDKCSWTYAPKGAPSNPVTRNVLVMDAVTKLFGKRLTDQCKWLSLTWCARGDLVMATESEAQLHDCSNEKDNYIFEGLLSNPDYTDVSTVNILRQFISIDSRPVKPTQGTLKQIVNIYKKSFQSVLAHEDNGKSTDPFLCLNITCPRRSYDANIEPAKDDVLFTDPTLLLQLAEKFFRDFYGEPQVRSTSIPDPGTIEKPRAFNLLLAKKPASRLETTISKDSRASQSSELAGISPIQSRHVANSVSPEKVQQSNRLRRKSLIQTDDEEEEGLETMSLDSSQDKTADGEELNGEDFHQDVSNPWALAKFNASLRHRSLQNRTAAEVEKVTQMPTPSRQTGDIFISPHVSPIGPIIGVYNQELPTPPHFPRAASVESYRSSPDIFPYPQKPRSKRQEDNAATKGRSKDREQNGALDTWIQSSTDGHDTDIYSISDDQSRSTQQPFISARTLVTGTRLEDIPERSRNPRQKPPQQKKQHQTDALRKPFVPPVQDPERNWFGPGSQNSTRPSHRTTPLSNPEPASLTLRHSSPSPPLSPASSLPSPIDANLALTMDYESRKQAATQQHRAVLRQQAHEQKAIERAAEDYLRSQRPDGGLSASPHKNRYDKAVAALHAEREPVSVFAKGDPRAYLLRTQQQQQQQEKSGAGSKRVRTGMLPLENVRDEDGVWGLVVEAGVTTQSIETGLERLRGYDSYVTGGEISSAFTGAGKEVVEAWEERVRRLLRGLLGQEEEKEGRREKGDGLQLDLAAALRVHDLLGVA